MRAQLLRTWVLLVTATISVLVLAAPTLKRGAAEVFVECHGDLEEDLASSEAASGPLAPAGAFRIDATERKRKLGPSVYDVVRIVRTREDGVPACNDVEIAWEGSDDPRWNVEIRDLGDGRYAAGASQPIVQDPSAKTVVIFRETDRVGRRFVAGNLLSPNQLPSAVALFALGALAVAALRARRAIAYATWMHGWTEARLRPDRLLESEGGTTLGTVDAGARVPAGPVIVDPSSLEGHGAYRALPIVTRGRVAAGTHGRWADGTMRRLRDAQMLSILATLVALAALAARLVG